MTYLRSCLSTPTSSSSTAAFSGKRLQELIDAFGPILTAHLHDEVESILALEKECEGREEGELKLEEMLGEMSKHSKGDLGPTTEVVAFWCNVDDEFEDGLHKGEFPPVGRVLGWVIRYVLSWPKREWRGWTSCGLERRAKELGGLPEEGEEGN